jgi:AcrR family transcriptional regulator
MTKNKETKVKIQLKSPTQERSRQTVATILEACALLMVQESFYEITTDKIAKEAGVSIGSLYQFFGNKESVVLALIKKINSEDKLVISGRVKTLSALPAEQRIHGIIEIMIDVMTSKPELRLKIQSIQNYLVDSQYVSELNAYYTSLFKQQIPNLPGRDMEKVAHIFVNLCFGFLNAIAIEKPQFPKDKGLVEEIMNLVCKYLDLNRPLNAVSSKPDLAKSY